MTSQTAVPKLDYCFVPPPIKTPGRLVAGVLALLLTALGSWMLWNLAYRQATKYPCEHAFHDGIDSPILALELASNAGELKSVINPECAEPLQHQAQRAIQRDTDADCFLIPLYTLFIWSFGRLFAVREDGARQGIRHLLGGIMILTAGADYTENFGIFRALKTQPSDWVAKQISWPSRTKWVLLGIGLLLVTRILLRSGNKIYSIAARRLFGIGYFLCAATIISAVWRPSLLGLGLELFSVLVVFQIVALLGPYVAGWIPPTLPKYEDNFCERKKHREVDFAVHR